MMPDTMPDQTQFVTESPLLEESTMGNVADQSLSEEDLKKLKQKKVKKIAILSVIFVFVLFIIFLLIKSSLVKKDATVIQTEETVLTEVVVGPFNQRLLELKNELEIADPNQEELPFPPIEYEISLEED